MHETVDSAGVRKWSQRTVQKKQQTMTICHVDLQAGMSMLRMAIGAIVFEACDLVNTGYGDT